MSVGQRPRPFAEDWAAEGTPRPPTTVPNPLGAAGRPRPVSLVRASVGERFQTLDPEALAGAGVETSGGIDLSPDGHEVAFAWDRTGDLEIYSAPLVGDRIIQLTDAGRLSFAPRWSPDGHWIAFLRDQGDGWARILLVDRDGEHERALTGDEDVSHGEVAWSPDGTRIAYVAARRDAQPVLHVMDVATGEHRRIGAGPDAAPRWSPDGHSLLFRSRAALAVVSADGGGTRALDVQVRDARDARWSREGDAVAFAYSDAGRSRVAIAQLRDGEVRRVDTFSATPFDDDLPVWRPDGRGIVYRHRRGGKDSLRRAFTPSHADEAVLDAPGMYHSHAVGPDSETVVALISQPLSPPDVFVRPRGAIENARITRSLAPSVDPGALVEGLYVEEDGAAAIVYLPHAEAGAGAAPVVIADPPGPLVRGWDAVAQLLANAGHAVVVGATPEAAAAVAGRLREAGLASNAAATLTERIPPLATRRDRIETFKRVLSWASGELRRS